MPRLTPRELDCLAWIGQGKSSWDIGMILGISENTVNYHSKRILRNLETSSRTVAVVKALHIGILELWGSPQIRRGDGAPAGTSALSRVA